MKKHIVVYGDTLTSISKKYGVSIEAIMKANSSLIKDKNLIKVGWVLSIPSETVSKPSESVSKPSEKDYEAIGKQFEKCLKDIENLESYKQLEKML